MEKELAAQQVQLRVKDSKQIWWYEANSSELGWYSRGFIFRVGT